MPSCSLLIKCFIAVPVNTKEIPIGTKIKGVLSYVWKFDGVLLNKTKSGQLKNLAKEKTQCMLLAVTYKRASF